MAYVFIKIFHIKKIVNTSCLYIHDQGVEESDAFS